MTRAVLAIPEMECKRVLACTGRLPKTHTGIIAHSDEKNSEKVLVNRKVFCLFTIYYNKGGWTEGGNSMTATYRRMEIVSILVVSGHVTARELAQEFGVSRRTILNDVVVLSYGYPIYTKPGAGGGIFIMEGYKPYNNTLTPYEQEKLKKMYDAAEGEDKEILKRVLKKYGAYKLEL